MPHPAGDSLTPHDIEQATRTLVRLKDYLRDEPPVCDVLPLLAPLLDEDTGVPVLLSDVLRTAARVVAQQSTLPWSDETRQVVHTFRQAAQDIMDWHVLHWHVRHLHSQPFGNPGGS